MLRFTINRNRYNAITDKHSCEVEVIDINEPKLEARLLNKKTDVYGHDVVSLARIEIVDGINDVAKAVFESRSDLHTNQT